MIVAYCGGPACTAWKKAAQDACKLGYTNIKHFKEGISGWKKD
jgi:rhodanese-related sulfurtransferase